MDPNKQSHMEQYLNEQQMVLYDKTGDNISMEEFKMFVKKWFELDNYIKKAQEIIREKRVQKSKLSEVIMKFMCKYNIEDLNTKEGRIRCKATYVKAPVNKQVVQQKIADYFVNDEERKKDIIQKIFEEREKLERTTLRRLKIT